MSASLGCAGCGLFGASSKPAAASSTKAVATPAPLRVHVTAQKDTNNGGPLYMVVRLTDDATYLAEDYERVARGVFTPEPDPKLLKTVVILPGDDVTLSVPWQADPGAALGVYFLFSAPGPSWRFSVKDPALKQLRVALGAREILSVAEGR